MGRPKSWARVPLALLEEPGITTHAIAVYVALKSFTDHGRETGARPSDTTIAERAGGCSVRSVSEARAFLKKRGWITWDHTPGRPNLYIVRNEPKPTRQKPHRDADARERPGDEPRQPVPRSIGEEDTDNDPQTPATGAEVGRTPATGAEVVTTSDHTSATGAEVPRHQVPSTEMAVTEMTDNYPAAAASVVEPAGEGEARPQQQKRDLTIEPDMEAAEMEATEAMRATVEELAAEYLTSEFDRRKFRAAATMVIEGGAMFWRDPHTGAPIAPERRPELFRTACLHHMAEPAHNLRSSLKYTLKVDLDPYNVPDDSEAAGARERETAARGAPTCEDPVRPDVAAMFQARSLAKSPSEQRRERARAFSESHPDEYRRMRDETVRRIRAKYPEPEIERMPARILEGMVLNDLERQIEDHQRREPS